MSEKENWEEKMRKIVSEEMDNKVKAFVQVAEKQINRPSSEKTDDAHKHWKASEVLNSDCPECELQANEIIRETMRKRRTDKEKYPVKCVECGTPVKQDEKDCPTCGGTEATERD